MNTINYPHCPDDEGLPHLLPWQWHLPGVVLGAGTPMPVSEVEGLGSPRQRTQDVNNPVADGALPGRDYFEPRTIRIEAGIKTPRDPAAAAGHLAELQRAVDAEGVRLETGELSVLRGRWPGHRTRRLYGRLRRAEATSTANAIHGWIPLDIEFLAMDPHFHADHDSHLELRLAQALEPSTGGTEHSGTSGPRLRPGWAVNEGDAAAWPALRIHGPIAGPKVVNSVTGQALELDTDLRAGEYVEIHTRPGTRWVLRNGETNAADDLTPASRLDRFVIPPGRSEITWSGEDPTDTCRLEVSWRSAYSAL